MNWTELFTPVAVAANWLEAGSNLIPYLGVGGLFTRFKKAGLDLTHLKGSRGLPVSLMPSAFDAKATFRDRIGVEKLTTEMPFFREGYKIKERDRQELLRAQDSNDPYLVAVLNQIFDDVGDLIAGADVVAERMIMQLLFPENGNAGIAIKANGVNYTYNYDPDGSWKTSNYLALTGDDLWTVVDKANPFMAFQTAKELVRDKTGSEIGIALMNSKTFNLLAATEAVKERYITTSRQNMGFLTETEVKKVVNDTSKLQIAIYDKKYRDESKVVHSFVPDGYVCLIPEGTLGGIWYGTTPEEADLMGSNRAEVEIVNTGVAITRVLHAHPVNIDIFASEIVLPSFDRMDEVAVLKVVGE